MGLWTQGYLSGAAARNQGAPCTPIPPTRGGGVAAALPQSGGHQERVLSSCYTCMCAVTRQISDRANKHQPIAGSSPCYLPADNMTWDGLHHWFARPGEATAEDLLRGRRTVAAALVTARSSGVVASHTPPHRKQPARRSPATALPSVSGCPTRPHANDHFARSDIADGWLTPCPLRSRIIPLDVVARWRLYRNKADLFFIDHRARSVSRCWAPCVVLASVMSKRPRSPPGGGSVAKSPLYPAP
jgi:hypothetical protein